MTTSQLKPVTATGVMLAAREFRAVKARRATVPNEVSLTWRTSIVRQGNNIDTPSKYSERAIQARPKAVTIQVFSFQPAHGMRVYGAKASWHVSPRRTRQPEGKPEALVL